MTVEGATLGIYSVGAELGRGGMGTVYRAETTADSPAGPAGSTVALKLFHKELVANEKAFARFKLEAEIGKEIHHPHLVRTYGAGSAEVDGETHHFMVMEVIEGQTLKDLLEELGTFPEQLIYQVSDQILSALHEIHERGVVHRDIKPENIVITPDHRALLMDLGVARRETGYAMTQAGMFLGSLVYAPPEQFHNVDVGRRADIYAFGVSLYELATGRCPFDATEVGTLIAQKLEGTIDPPRSIRPDIDPFLDRVIETCVRREQAARFATAGELRDVLREGEQSEWWRLTAHRAVPSAEHALNRLRLERRTPLIGRVDDLEFLREQGARAREHGAVVMIGGFSGVGKSRLLYDYLESVAGAGGPLIAAGCAVGTGGLGYGPFIEALGDMIAPDPSDRRAALEELLSDTPGIFEPVDQFLRGSLQPGPEAGLSKDALLASVVKLVRGSAADRPVVLAIEDLHLAGDETVELFNHLARNVEGHPIYLLGVYDLDEVVDSSPLEALIMGGPVTGRLVNVLPRADTAELVRHVVIHERSVHALAPTLHEKSEGRPLIVLEVLAHLQEAEQLVEAGEGLELAGEIDQIAVPSTVRDLFSLKLGRLDDEQRETLEVAAILGPVFDSSLLATVLEDKPIELLQRLAGLERRQRLLKSAGKGSFRFASNQLFESVYESITPALRVEYHELVADTLLEHDEEPSGARAYALLRHLQVAERAVDAGPVLEGALDYMGRNFHAHYAAPFLEKTAVAFEAAPAEQRFKISMRLWGFYELLASRDDQMRVLDGARVMAEEMDDPGARARVHALRAGSHWYAGDYDNAWKDAEAGLGLAREAGDRKWEATCHHTLGVVHYRRGQPAECAAEWKEALRIRREIGDRRGEASTLQALGFVMPAIGEADQALGAMEESLAIWREIGDRRGEASMLGNLGNRYVDMARYDKGLLYLEQAIEGHRETGALINEALALNNLGRAHDIMGRIDDAKAAWQRALPLFVDLKHPRGELEARLMMGIALAAYGEQDEARGQLEAAIGLAESTGQKTRLAVAQCALGELLHAAGRQDDGWEHVELALEMGDAGERVFVLGAAAKLALAQQDYGRATTFLDEALPTARNGSQAPLVLCRLARAHRGEGQEEEARRLAREARDWISAGGSVPADDGPEIYYTLYGFGGEATLLSQARALVEERAGRIRNDTYRDHYLTRTWPNAEIMKEKGPAADATGP